MGRGVRHYDQDFPHEEVTRMHLNGIGILSIAVRLKIPARNVRRYLCEGERVTAMVKAGRSVEQIAKALNISQKAAAALARVPIRVNYYIEKGTGGLPDYMI
tara:strand:- start:2536 stop:2841 length:306 start_codon:yes stop_codon:yes gene_type:complete